MIGREIVVGGPLDALRYSLMLSKQLRRIREGRRGRRPLHGDCAQPQQDYPPPLLHLPLYTIPSSSIHFLTNMVTCGKLIKISFSIRRKRKYDDSVL